MTVEILKRITIEYQVWSVPIAREIIEQCKLFVEIDKIIIICRNTNDDLDKDIRSMFNCKIEKTIFGWNIILPELITSLCKVNISHKRIQIKTESISNDIEKEIIRVFGGDIIQKPIILDVEDDMDFM